MDTPDLLKIVRRHYDDAPHGEGQYLHGSYFKPKHQDSLEFLLDEVTKVYDDERMNHLEKIESLIEKVDDLKEQLDGMKEDAE